MARNGSGTMTIPNTLVSGTTITASDHNENYSDIATEITNSVAADGQTPMTGPFKASSGTAAAPSITFSSDTDSGFYRIGSNNVGAAVAGSKVLDIASTGLSITGTLTSSGAIVPSASDGAALGSASLMWSDLFLASGGVVNFNNGDVTVTHSANALAFAGATSGYTFDNAVTVSAGGFTVTAGGLTVTSGAISLPSASLSTAAFPTGTIINRAYTSTAATTSLTTQIPADDTTPTSSEGTEVMSVSITTSASSSRVNAKVTGFISTNSDSTAVIALFRGTTCLNVQATTVIASAQSPFSFEFEDSPGSAASHTYSVRVGPAGAVTLRLNSAGLSRLFGGTAVSTLTLLEIKV